MGYYVSEKDVREAIEYFQTAPFVKDDTMGIFLVFKHLGISTSREIKFQSNFRDFTDSVDLVAKITDPSEYYEFGSFFFPFMFAQDLKKKDENLYQKKSKQSSVVSRIRDTIKQKNNKIKLYNASFDTPSYAKLLVTYKDTISSKYLNGAKISLKHLAAWLYRFTEFDFETMPSDATFSRVVRKMVIKYFGIAQSDFDWLFEDDMQLSLLSADSRPVTGKRLRELLFITDDILEALNQGSSTEKAAPEKSHKVDTKVIEQYMELNGDNPSSRSIFETLKAKKQIILTGVPGIGKSRYTKLLAENKIEPDFFAKTETVQFHANFTYDEFIGGTKLENQEGTNEMQVVQHKGVLLRIIEEATKEENKDNNYLLVIDEINRGNIAAILGETILALDRDYKVKLAQPIAGISEIQLPQNLYIVGTMNTSDRNIAFLDMAIRRRFAFIELNPNYDFLSEAVTLKANNEDGKEVAFNLGGILKKLNDRIYGLTMDKDKLLGQSYLIPQTPDFIWDAGQFQNQFNFVLLPAIKEYEFQKNGITQAVLGDRLSSQILDKEEFYNSFMDQFAELVL